MGTVARCRAGPAAVTVARPGPVGHPVAGGLPFLVERPVAPDACVARVAAGLPPAPDTATFSACIADLDAIDPDIVRGEDDKPVSRGPNQ
ncbi:hypothetical protein ACIPSE_19590 [Streptomyces sp. NPDC090106]|uniref:hypothetical protein n=1 Tax=Streptomyces sp. NPDC090106 TaxID=3365946 RepID=UPI0038247199